MNERAKSLIPSGILHNIESALADKIVSGRKKLGRLRAMKPIRYEVERTDLTTKFFGSRQYASTKALWKKGVSKSYLMYKAFEQDDMGRIREYRL